MLNAGSSSLKFKTFQRDTKGALGPGVGGVFERIGDESNSCLIAKGIDASGQQTKWELKIPARYRARLAWDTPHA